MNASGDSGSAADASPPVSVFISYRRGDDFGEARALRSELVAEFGDEHVFMDVNDLHVGDNFVRELPERVGRCDVLLAVIGPRWAETMDQRLKDHQRDGSTDYVRVEIETALGRGTGTRVLPVVLGGAGMPDGRAWPASLRGFGELTAAFLEPRRWDDDVRALISRIHELVADVGAPEPPATVPPMPPTPAPPRIPTEPTQSAPVPPAPTPSAPVDPVPIPSATPAATSGGRSVPPPDPGHFDDISRLILRDNAVVPFLGRVVNDSGGPGEWVAGGETLPDGEQLAAYLAAHFDYRGTSDLATIAQFALIRMGRVDLYKALRSALKHGAPGHVHRFLAELPDRLAQMGHPDHSQLLITTNYDDALERACDDAGEPYDLAVYMASGENKGKFIHVPYDGEARPIIVPNSYLDFPIDEDGELHRTIILKIHGAVDRAMAPGAWRENYVITENDYIDYLSRAPIETLVPTQLLSKLRESHFLFLGYRIRDWNLRVFLHRVWGDQQLGAKSWAVVEHGDDVEQELWDNFGVGLFDSNLSAYLDSLLTTLTAASGAPAR